MQAIQVKYLSATNHKPSRLKAKCKAASSTVSWDYALDDDANHRAAADRLIKKLGWTDIEIIGSGQLADGSMVYTLGRRA